jgi:hypothetical protein
VNALAIPFPCNSKGAVKERCASSSLSSLVADRRPGSSSK